MSFQKSSVTTFHGKDVDKNYNSRDTASRYDSRRTYDLSSDDARAEDVESNHIDFDQELEDYRRRTETEIPYVNTVGEDAMYLDQHTVLVLEYFCYQNTAQYSKLQPLKEKINERGMLVDEQGEEVKHLLGTHQYQADVTVPINHNSMFNRRDLVNLQLKAPIQESSSFVGDFDFNDDRFMTADKSLNEKCQLKNLPGNSYRRSLSKAFRKISQENQIYVEPVIAMYNINTVGDMQRRDTVPVKMGRRFQPSRNGNINRDANMTLTRSRDKSIISLTHFEKYDSKANHFKILAWTTKLQPWKVNDALIEGLNQYYETYSSSINSIEEIQFCGQCQYLMFTYIESANRDQNEQKLFEKDLTTYYAGHQRSMSMPNKSIKDEINYQKEKPRLARKHVFFDASNGNVIWQYGGVHDVLKVQNQNGDTVECYELGIQIQEVRDNGYKPIIYFFLAGDFWKTKDKDKFFCYKWCLLFLPVDMNEIFQIKSQSRKQKFLNEKFQSSIPGLKDADFANQYLFDEQMILDDIFNWEINISVSTNRQFDLFSIINTPLESVDGDQSNFMMNGPAFKKQLPEGKNGEQKFDMPLFIKLPDGARITHGRNANIKTDLFYDILLPGGELRTYCCQCRMNRPDTRNRCINIKYDVDTSISQRDNWLQYKKNLVTKEIVDVFQSICVTSGHQQAANLRTRIPTKMIDDVPVEFKMIDKYSNLFSQQQGNHPYIVYNLGQNKMVVQNTQTQNIGKSFILELNENERFVCFIQFNKYEDIGFFTDDLQIECCSHIAYLTRSSCISHDHISANKINLLLIDPFYEKPQMALFKSNCHYDNELHDSHDFIIKTVVQSTMSHMGDFNYHVYLWSQIEGHLVRSKMLKNHNERENEEVDSDDLITEQDVIDKLVTKDHYRIARPIAIENITLIQNDRGYIYYITNQDGHCKIMEGSPKQPWIKEHYPVYEYFSETTLAFSNESRDMFFLMTEDYVVQQLVRSVGGRSLNCVREFTMRDNQKLDMVPFKFDNYQMNEKYVIFKDLVLYLYDTEGKPFADGIFESEKLVADERYHKISFVKGPYRSEGSTNFYSMFQKNQFNATLKIFTLPDKTQQILINDFQNYVDMSTFLENGNILIRSRRRFMVFTHNGTFIDEVAFVNDPYVRNLVQKQLSPNNDTFISVKDEIHALIKGGITVEPINQSTKLLNKNQEKIYDFKGNEYNPDDQDQIQNVSEFNKMHLLSFSQDNKHFLFMDRLLETWEVYQLEQLGLGDITDITFEFQLQFQMQFCDCVLFHYLKLNGVDPFEFYMKNQYLINIDNAQEVKLCYCENLGVIDKKNGPQIDQTEMKLKVIGAIFSQKDDLLVSKCKNFTETCSFPIKAIENQIAILDIRKTDLRIRIKLINMKQRIQPSHFHDYSEYDYLIKELKILEAIDVTKITARIFSENLVIVYCCNSLKFGWLQEKCEYGSKKTKDKDDLHYTDKYDYIVTGKVPSDGDFPDLGDLDLDHLLKKGMKGKEDQEGMQSINLILTDDTTITDIVETDIPNVLQIVARNYKSKIYYAITWDFNTNCEVKMFQQRTDEKQQVGNHVIKGMNFKLNYYLDQNYLNDFENNLPILQKNVDQNIDYSNVDCFKQIKCIQQFQNQRKLYEDNERFLGVEKAHCLFYDLSKMDVMIWKNLEDKGNQLSQIKQSTSIDSFNCKFNGSSLFHHFSNNHEIIQLILEKIEMESEIRTLTETEKTLPLFILFPDDNNKTALQLSLDNQSPKSFEIMTELLSKSQQLSFQDRTITYLMLKSFKFILSSNHQSITGFLNDCYFQPPQMQIEQFIPWDEECEEMVFSSHTSFISQGLLFQKLEEQGIDIGEYSDVLNGTSKKKKTKNLSYREILDKKNNLKSFNLGDELAVFEDFESKSLKRVNIEAIDFDWIFQDQNAKEFITILAKNANGEVLVKKQVRIFIDLIWGKYQPTMIRWMFVPYLLYLCMTYYMSGYCIANYLHSMMTYGKKTPFQKYLIKHRSEEWLHNIVLIPIIFCFTIYFSRRNVLRLVELKSKFFQDGWLCIDFITSYINVSVQMMCLIDLMRGDDFYGSNLILTVSAFTVFLMWIKVFYWCRLFQQFAYFIKLIIQTIYECGPFMKMVLIVLCSYASYFYVENVILHHEKSRKYHYIGEYFNNEVIDSVVSIYVIGALGQFSDSRFRHGETKKYIMLMFLFSCFVVTVVFMNMLIAIMSDTYARVSQEAEESSLREQIGLIYDHLYLLDIDKIFKGQKYVIRVFSSKATEATENETAISNSKKQQRESLIHDTKLRLAKKIDDFETKVNLEIHSLEQNNKYSIGKLFDGIQSALYRLRDVGHYLELLHNPETKEMKEVTSHKEQAHRISEELSKAIQLTKGDLKQLTVRDVYEKAVNWAMMMDIDQSGFIDFEEFANFFIHSTTILLREDQIAELFHALDPAAEGVTIHQFATQVTALIVPEGTDGDQLILPNHAIGLLAKGKEE